MELGSIIRKLRFLSKKNLTPEAAEKLFEEGKEALRRRIIDGPGAETVDKLASATERLIKATEKIPNIVIRLADFLFVKFTKDGISSILVETISPLLARMMMENPEILSDPKATYHLLQSQSEVEKKIKEGNEKLQREIKRIAE